MTLNYKNVVYEMRRLLPVLNTLYIKELNELWEENGTIPPHVAFGNILNPYLINLLQINHELTDSEDKLLVIIFGFIEKMALSNDVDVRNVVSTTVMARLGDDTTVLTNALKYLGEQTKVLSKEIEASYGRSGNLKILDSTNGKR
ncbi:hypothetical protein [Paenibacillus sp. P13VS]|uniref:DUF7674 family protein n=1 Tax=Paenibacillus sp. P13VS TaxID=2697367 RepID=UPI00187BC349|nr:hypothetical protein [Paenibacillus sp. P13VS]MBE7682227.1 hypothetical protein [Paenibacillus sp. P13VS]